MATSSFSLNIAKFVEKTKTKADLVLKSVGFEALSAVVVRSPVDTGFFRASWRVGINDVDLSTPGSPGRTKAERDAVRSVLGAGGGVAAVGTGAAKIAEAKFGDTINITNNVEYAEALENGHSGQAPAGVLKVAFEEVRLRLEGRIAGAGAL